MTAAAKKEEAPAKEAPKAQARKKEEKDDEPEVLLAPEPSGSPGHSPGEDKPSPAAQAKALAVPEQEDAGDGEPLTGQEHVDAVVEHREELATRLQKTYTYGDQG